MGQYIKETEKRLADKEGKEQELLEKINTTSKNSSSPPSLDTPNVEKSQTKKKTGKKRGGQPGHPGHSRKLYSESECQSIFDYHPKTCSCCGEELKGEDATPYRHQVVEIPPIKPIIIEHRLHQLACEGCGTLTRATLPIEVPLSGYGVRVVAIVSVLSGLYRHSQRMVQSALRDLLAINMSLGTVNKLRRRPQAEQ